MENQNLSLQPQQASQSQQSQSLCQTSTKNIKNSSIKDFFTSKLMRARSFEGGGHSPKDEAPNWFDEFKARMTKKSQSSSNKHNPSNPLDDNISEEVTEPGDGSNPKFTYPMKANKNLPHYKDEFVTSQVKDFCDNPLGKLSESLEDLNEDSLIEQHEDSINLIHRSTSVINNNLRTRKNNKDFSPRCPDFDTASISTIFDTRESRQAAKSVKDVSCNTCSIRKPLDFIRWFISYTLPLNYTLPWKLLSMINFAFVILVLGLASETRSGMIIFNFFNGFVCGILVTAICFVILFISVITQILPSSKHKSSPSVVSDNHKFSRSLNINNSESKATDKQLASESEERISNEPYSQIEIISGCDSNCDDTSYGVVRSENLLEDDDYKGWMIEFVGDYEQRNKSDFKLKLVFVKIEHRILHLCKPKNNHEAESSTFPVFVQQRTYNLNLARKFSANLLLPKSVRNRQKYVWSKKYPIKLEFIDESDQNSTKSSENEVPKAVQLTLFSKSCREKEEWFRRFKRIVEENRLAPGRSSNRASMRSDTSREEVLDSLKSHMSISSSLSNRRDLVQTSQSSHLLNGPSNSMSDGIKKSDQSTGANISRTKSCEQLNAERCNNDGSSSDTDQTDCFKDLHDDATLTRETAELFSQAIEYSNFIESQPTLNYKEYIERVIESSQEATSTSDWFNALTGRIFFDVFSHNYWSLWFKRKIQRKLYRIRLPYFMETLTLTQIDLGSNAPQLLNVVSHTFDSFGLSIDFEMAYSGGLTMTFETKLNLLKIKSDNSSTVTNNTTSSNPPTSSTNNTTFNNVNISSQMPELSSKEPAPPSSVLNVESLTREDHGKPFASSSNSTRTSGESSDSDDSESTSSSDMSFEEGENDEISDWEDYGAEKTRQSIVKFVDKIASSRYFQHATENRYIKKKLQDISNCPLVLIVQIQSLSGVMTVNVPPPPTDRIWYGFKPNPELTLRALPKMGDREVNLSHVTDWIERKLAEEFKKILVIPNMEDIFLPVLKSDHLLYVTPTR